MIANLKIVSGLASQRIHFSISASSYCVFKTHINHANDISSKAISIGKFLDVSRPDVDKEKKNYLSSRLNRLFSYIGIS